MMPFGAMGDMKALEQLGMGMIGMVYGSMFGYFEFCGDSAKDLRAMLDKRLKEGLGDGEHFRSVTRTIAEQSKTITRSLRADNVEASQVRRELCSDLKSARKDFMTALQDMDAEELKAMRAGSWGMPR